MSKMSQEKQQLGCQLQHTALLSETERRGRRSASTPTFARHHMRGQGRWGTCANCESLGDTDTLAHRCLTNSQAKGCLSGYHLPQFHHKFKIWTHPCTGAKRSGKTPVHCSWRVSADFSGCWIMALERV